MDTPGSSLTKPTKHHIVPVTIAVVSLVLIVLIGIYTVLTYRQQDVQTPQQVNKQQGEKNYSFPRLTVNSWKIADTAEPKTAAVTAAVYPLNAKYSRSEFNSLLFHFFTPTSTRETRESLRAYSEAGGSSMLYMQKDTGSFLFKSDTGIPIATASSSLDQTRRIVAFAQDALKDDTLASFATYQKRSNPGVTYYELHRDWNRLGFPLLNLFGLLNVKSTDLRTISLSQSTNQVASDPDVIETSDNSDGRKRPNDFNTVTIGVRDGKIVDVISNLRLFPTNGSAKPVTNKLISYDEAVKKLKKNEYSRLYTSPAGEGALDREKLYPQNKATLNEAVVSETTIAYLEELPGSEQTMFAPYYVFRGTGELSTGFRVTFVATVAATAQNVLGTYTAQSFNSTQQQGTFEFDVVSKPPDIDSPDEGDPPPLPPINQVCERNPKSVSELYNTQIDDATGATFGQYDLQPEAGVGSYDPLDWYGPQWFVVSAKNHDINLLNTVIDTAKRDIGLKADSAGASNRVTIREFDSLFNDWEEADISCPVRLTGRSPSLFVYSETPMKVTISLADRLTYSDPPVRFNQWNITTPTKHLYYEYVPVKFTRPTLGWNVTKAGLDGFARSIARRLALTPHETDRLVHELTNAAHDVNSDNVFVGFISSTELATYLPLTVSPAPSSLHRIHFHLSEVTDSQVEPPWVTPIVRTSYTVVELGATD